MLRIGRRPAVMARRDERLRAIPLFTVGFGCHGSLFELFLRLTLFRRAGSRIESTRYQTIGKKDGGRAVKYPGVWL